jgi:hypothetical protein
MAEKIEIEFELKYKDALKNVDKLEKELKDVQETIKKSNEETVKGIEDVEKSAEGGAKGIKKVGLSIKNIASAVGIVALLQKAFEFVSNAIQENQQVMDGLNIVFETAQIVPGSFFITCLKPSLLISLRAFFSDTQARSRSASSHTL